MVDIRRFECVQEMKRIQHLQFLWGKYLLFPEPRKAASDLGVTPEFLGILDGATAS